MTNYNSANYLFQEKCIASLWLVGSHTYRLVQARSRPKGLEEPDGCQIRISEHKSLILNIAIPDWPIKPSENNFLSNIWNPANHLIRCWSSTTCSKNWRFTHFGRCHAFLLETIGQILWGCWWVYKKNVENCAPLILKVASLLKTIGQTPGSFWESLVLFSFCGFPVLETIILMTSENITLDRSDMTIHFKWKLLMFI